MIAYVVEDGQYSCMDETQIVLYAERIIAVKFQCQSMEVLTHMVCLPQEIEKGKKHWYNNDKTFKQKMTKAKDVKQNSLVNVRENLNQ